MSKNWAQYFDKLMEFCGIRIDNYPSIQDFWFARSAFIFTNIGLTVALSYMILYIMTGAYAAALSISTVAVSLIVTHPLHWYGKTRLLARINLAATSFGLAGVTLHLGGIQSSVACWLLGTAPGIAALLFRSVKEIVALTLVAMLLYLGIFVLEIRGYPIFQSPFSEGSFAHSLFTFITFMSFAGFICIALSIFAISQKKLYEALQRNKERTEATSENIRVMFHFMQQAMFTVDDQLCIANQNEEQFSRVIGSEVNNLSVFMQRSSLSDDRGSMVKSIIQTCVGEGIESYEFNAHHLPDRFHYRKTPESDQQVLLLQWAPVMRGSQIRAILVAVRDNTEAELDEAREKEVQNRNSFLLALLKAPSAIVPLTIADMVDFERKLDTAMHAERFDIRGFKAIIHTLKGNARSFGLPAIAERCHTIESRLVEFPSLDDTEMKELVMSLRSDLKFFVKIFEEDLAPKNSELGRINLERQELVQLVDYLKQQTPRYPSLDALEALIKSKFEPLMQIIRNDLKQIAEELGKPSPRLIWNVEDCRFSDEHTSLLINILGHLIRNSCDHGIEAAHERLLSNKPVHGHITIDLHQDQNGYALSFRDDGKGLDLARIRHQLRLLGKENLDAQQLATYIFEPEFSTKNSVSSISGRGIGMMAVAEELKSIGGNISIEFTAAEERGFRPFTFYLSWPLQKSA